MNTGIVYRCLSRAALAMALAILSPPSQAMWEWYRIVDEQGNRIAQTFADYPYPGGSFRVYALWPDGTVFRECSLELVNSAYKPNCFNPLGLAVSSTGARGCGHFLGYPFADYFSSATDACHTWSINVNTNPHQGQKYRVVAAKTAPGGLVFKRWETPRYENFAGTPAPCAEPPGSLECTITVPYDHAVGPYLTLVYGHAMNDTGQTACHDDAGGAVACGGTAYPRQDGRYGRDVASPSKLGGGDAGFDFTKLRNDGAALANQGLSWSRDGAGFDNGGEDAGTRWSCVKDNVTGLVWEAKSHAAPADPRDRDWTYTWYDHAAAQPGQADGGAGQNGDNCHDNSRCDSEKYVADVNAAALCGYTDWRLPNPRELHSLSHKGRSNPAIDTAYFPNTAPGPYWSASTYAPDPASAWAVDFLAGTGISHGKALTDNRVRLVRGGKL